MWKYQKLHLSAFVCACDISTGRSHGTKRSSAAQCNIKIVSYLHVSREINYTSTVKINTSKADILADPIINFNTA